MGPLASNGYLDRLGLHLADPNLNLFLHHHRNTHGVRNRFRYRHVLTAGYLAFNLSRFGDADGVVDLSCTLLLLIVAHFERACASFGLAVADSDRAGTSFRRADSNRVVARDFFPDQLVASAIDLFLNDIGNPNPFANGSRFRSARVAARALSTATLSVWHLRNFGQFLTF